MDIKKVVQAISQEVDALQGNQTKDKQFSSDYTCGDEEKAHQAFQRAREKLFLVGDWSGLPGLTATFTVHDLRGNPTEQTPVGVGDYIQIDLPGPLPSNWVRVVDEGETETVAHFTVVPCEAPLADGDAAPVEHFFTAEASSTFRVERQGNQLIASETGRNERVNNEETTAGSRALLNTLIAAGGWALFQETQWKKLTEYLVQP